MLGLQPDYLLRLSRRTTVVFAFSPSTPQSNAFRRRSQLLIVTAHQAEPNFRNASICDGEVTLWVQTGSVGASSSFPLYPSKQTSTVAAATSYRLRQCPPNSCGVRLSRGGGHAQLQFWPPVWSAIDRRTGCRPNPNGPRRSICVRRDELPAAPAA